MSPKSNDFLQEIEYIDGVTIIDNTGKIQYSIKFNPNFYPEMIEKNIIGKKLDEVFTNINQKTSTLYSAINQKKIIQKKTQKVTDITGCTIETMNVSIPIKANGEIIGAIELSKDITSQGEREKYIFEIDKAIFQHKFLPEYRLGSDQARYTLDDIISNDSKIEDIKSQIRHLSDNKAPVFIYGETGTGKELFAHAVHNASERKAGPFIAQNCAAIPENLLESILFGATKGSYTGAIDAPGLFELADGGSLFLDEINSMPIGLQAKMLRVLEEGYVRRLGGKKEKKIDVRIISASNEEPLKCIQSNKLRQDIYYRLCVLYFAIPPLRHRIGDIKALMDFFITRYNQQLDRNITKVSKSVYHFFARYDWPGNIRELDHFLQYGISNTHKYEETLEYHHIKQRVMDIKAIEQEHIISHGIELQPIKDAVEALERQLIQKSIQETGGNVSRASRILQMPRQTLQRKINFYDAQNSK
ncbi:sigma-54-dependent Fis family transcriptional regulator [Fusibacter sp. 3D3]|uniref:sigma-54 interaction domain-containing protein n=1 Tax=Fusibacter sp. 3D3 TaxID=1048380 RepID=UPI0008532732|nr:sigma 54-interacting transcriptional regulator [Fusibacter sp. 3D3]GAU75955.1 arginine utilization regulatory protein RocR [Fusibacter sp. 3D3]